MAILPMNDQVSKGQDLAFDVSRQFLTLSLGGIGFAVGVTGQQPEVFLTCIFWVAILSFVFSMALGFMFLMNGVSTLGQGQGFDVYGRLPRTLSGLQVIFVLVGSVLILVIHSQTVSTVPKVTNVVVEVASSGEKTSLSAPAGSTVELTVETNGTIRAAIK